VEENEDHLGEEEVVLIVMVMMMSGMVVRVNVNMNRMPLREVKWAESRLQIIKRMHDK